MTDQLSPELRELEIKYGPITEALINQLHEGGEHILCPLDCGRPPDAAAPAATNDNGARAGFRVELSHTQRVGLEYARMLARADATRLFDAQQARGIELPALIRLDRFLALPDDPVFYRIADLLPIGGRVVCAAAKKAGKTTLNGNLIRSLVDGVDFLGRYKVQPMGRLILIDNELDERMLRRWLRDHGIEHTERVELVSLRGRLATFNLIDQATRQRWAEQIGPADGLILDCLRPALDALGLDESHEAGRFLEAFDELLTAAHIGEALITHHHGHGDTERARGDSRILDWPDANWNLIEESTDGEDRRVYFKARGRDVDQPEQLLIFSPHNRRLTIGGGDRTTVRISALIDDVVEFVTEHPGASQNAVETSVEGRGKDIRDALVKASQQGLITRVKDGRKWVHGLPQQDQLPGDQGDES